MVTLTQPFWNLGCRVGVLSLKGVQTQTVYYPLNIIMHLLCILNKFSGHAMGKQTCAKAKPNKERQHYLYLIVVS